MKHRKFFIISKFFCEFISVKMGKTNISEINIPNNVKKNQHLSVFKLWHINASYISSYIFQFYIKCKFVLELRWYSKIIFKNIKHVETVKHPDIYNKLQKNFVELFLALWERQYSYIITSILHKDWIINKMITKPIQQFSSHYCTTAWVFTNGWVSVQNIIMNLKLPFLYV